MDDNALYEKLIYLHHSLELHPVSFTFYYLPITQLELLNYDSMYPYVIV